jgi:AraC-like DNA-binding protein
MATGCVLNEPAKPTPLLPEPVLGQAGLAYRERPVFRTLRRHFARAWFHAPEDSGRRSAIVPDGSADLVFANGVLWFAGPDRRVAIETGRPGEIVVGLRFQPGAAPAWLRESGLHIVGARLRLECFWGPEARRLAEWIAEAATPEEVATRLERALTRRLPEADPPDAASKAIFHAIARRRSHAAPIMRQLTEYFGVSERTLRRRCDEIFGFGPRTLDRILRFQRFLRLAHSLPFHPTADLALIAGYADQSHLTREAREMAGLTPTIVRQQLARSRV